MEGKSPRNPAGSPAGREVLTWVNDPNVACLHTLRNEFVQQTRPTQAELDELIETGAAQ